MRIFNSLGSNYDLSFALRALLTSNSTNSPLKLKEYLENKYGGKAKLLYKGREAISLALFMADLPKGSEVAVCGFTCYAVYKAVKDAGYEASYVDITQKDLNFSAYDLEEVIKKNSAIKVVIIQNTLGYACDIKGIIEVCKKNDLILIEDLAHSIGAVYADGREAGLVGDFTILSFSQDKIIDGISGGALIVRNKKYQVGQARKLEHLRAVEQVKDRFYPLFTLIIRSTYSYFIGKVVHLLLKKMHLLSQPMDGGESLHILPEWYADLTLKQFEVLDGELRHRRKIAKVYSKHIDSSLLVYFQDNQIERSSNLRFPIMINKRKEFFKYMKLFGVHISDTWYDAPIAPKKYMIFTDYINQCPNSEKISTKIINLPTHKNISEVQANFIAEKINVWMK